MIKRIFRKTVIAAFILLALVLLFAIWANLAVSRSTKNKVFDSTSEIPHNKVGLLLGTSKYVQGGYVNLYYRYRIEAAVELFNAGKIDFIIVSGDNSRKSYDEPTTMKNDLVKAGIPSNKIFLDYAGFRTLDSVVRSKEIFGQESITVISQQFHNQRAIYIAKRKDISAVGFNAKNVSRHYGFKTNLREKLARVKMAIDLIFGKSPKFLGEKIEITD